MHTDSNIRVVEALDWNVRGRSGPGLERPGLRKEEEAAAAGKGKEDMSKSKEQWRERTQKKRVGKREEEAGKEKRTNAWNIRGSGAA